jgi:hypothetical protein
VKIKKMGKYSKGALLEKAVEIAKAHAKGGDSRNSALVLREVYEELKKINEELNEE